MRPGPSGSGGARRLGQEYERLAMAVFAEHTRFEQYDEIYISPHLDDVVYSSGGHIAQQRKLGVRVLVVTLFGDGASDPLSKLADRFADFEARRKEDKAATERVDADCLWFNYPDFVFRKPGLGDVLRIAFPFMKLPPTSLQGDILRDVLALCETRLAPGGKLVFPLSVGFHPDHRIVFDVGRAVHGLGRFTVEFYEDIPYALAPVMVALRLRYLGLKTTTPLLRSAHEMNFALFRFFGVPWLTFIPTLIYTLVLFLVHGLLKSQDRLHGEPVPVRLEPQPIDDVIDDKVAAIRLYPSQTALFLTMDDSLYAMLKRDGGFAEARWRFPPFADQGARAARLGVAPQQAG